MAKMTDVLMNEKEAKEFISRNFGKQLDLLSELREYGLNLLSRCYLAKPRHSIRDDVVFGILFKHILAMLDSVLILVKEGAVVSSFLPARSLLETSLFMDWILQNEGKEKFYFVWNLRQQRFLLEKKKGADMDEEERRQNSSALESIKGTLSSEEYRDINRLFEDIQDRDRLHREPEWYDPAGVNSIRDIAEAVSRLEDYVCVINDFSETVQASPLNHQADGRFQVAAPEPIRHPVRITIVLPVAFGATIHAYRSIIEQYRSAELNDFRVKCLTECQPVIDDMPVIKINLDNGGGDK